MAWPSSLLSEAAKAQNRLNIVHKIQLEGNCGVIGRLL